MRQLLWIGSALTALLIGGCAASGSRCADLPGGGRYCLQTTAVVEPFDVQQKVDVVFDGRQETMIAQIETDASGMRFAGMTPFGQKLVQLGFDNSEVRAETLPVKRLDPALLLALVQIATWPADSVRSGLEGSAAIEDADGQRVLLRDGKDVVVIRYTRGLPPFGDMSIKFSEAGIEFAIVNLDMADTK